MKDKDYNGLNLHVGKEAHLMNEKMADSHQVNQTTTATNPGQKKRPKTQEKLAEGLGTSIGQVLDKVHHHTDEDDFCSMFCLRCLYDGKTTQGVCNSHTTPDQYLKRISGKDGNGNGKGLVARPNFTQNPDGSYAQRLSPTHKASTLPLFCGGDEYSCESYYRRNGEDKPVEFKSTKFYQVCAIFCERLVFADQHQASLQAENLSVEFSEKMKSMSRQIQETHDSPDVGIEALSQLSLKVVEVENSKRQLLSNPDYCHDQAVAWARRIIAGDYEEFSCFCVFFENPLPWTSGEMTILERGGDKYTWFFVFNLDVTVDGARRYALIYIPVLLIGPPGSTTEPAKKVASQAGLNKWTNTMNKHWDNQRQQLAFGICSYSISRGTLWSRPEVCDDIASTIPDTHHTRLDGSVILEETLESQLRNPSTQQIENMLLSKPALRKFCDDILANNAWTVHWKVNNNEGGDPL